MMRIKNPQKWVKKNFHKQTEQDEKKYCKKRIILKAKEKGLLQSNFREIRPFFE